MTPPAKLFPWVANWVDAEVGGARDVPDAILRFVDLVIQIDKSTDQQFDKSLDQQFAKSTSRPSRQIAKSTNQQINKSPPGW
jgi:hypothetical protein